MDSEEGTESTDNPVIQMGEETAESSINPEAATTKTADFDAGNHKEDSSGKSPEQTNIAEPMDETPPMVSLPSESKGVPESKLEELLEKEDEDNDVELVEVKIKEVPFSEPVKEIKDRSVEEMDISVIDVETTEAKAELSGEKALSAGSSVKPEEKPTDSVAPETTVATTVNAGASSSTSSKPSLVIPLQSLKIPSLGSRVAGPQKVSDKEIKPTVPPAQLPPGNRDLQILAYSKAISSALAPPKLPSQKRKLTGGCSNINCTRRSNELVIAPSSAILYYHFNTKLKKVNKICSHCLNNAEAYIEKATKAAESGDCIFTFKTEPQGMDGDVIEVSEGEEEDDPADVRTVEEGENEIVELTGRLDDVLSEILGRIDTKTQVEKCEKTVHMEANCLERDLNSLDTKLSVVEKQMLEAKKAYDVVSGHHQPLPIVLEQLDIDSDGFIKKSQGENPHISKLADKIQQSVKNIIRKKAERGEISAALKDEKKRSVTKDDEGEIMEVGALQKPSIVESKVALTPTPKVLPRVMPSVGSIVYALNRTLLHFWLKGEVIEVLKTGPSKPLEFIVRFETQKKGKPGKEGFSQFTKQVTSKQVAYNLPCPFVLPVGARIIAKFKDELKTEPVGDGKYYAGVVAEPPKNTNDFRYLVFFDDGYAQYVHHKEVLMVCESSKDVWADVHPDSSDFIKNYVQKYPERPMVRLSVGQVVTTEWNGQWWVARVIELDCSLVKMKFENDGRHEWIYRGSTRLSPLYEKQNRQKTKATARRHVSTVPRGRNQPTIEYNYGDDDNRKSTPAVTVKPVARKSTCGGTPQDKNLGNYGMRMPHYDYGEFEGTIIKKPIPESAPKTKEFVPHKCGSSCVSPFNEFDREFRKYNPLAVPLHLGWSREIGKTPRRNVFYRSPCGRRLRDMEELYTFFQETRCEIPVDYFCFDLAVDCLNEFRQARQHSYLPDLTYGKELTPVQVVNAFDFEYPPYVEYSSSRIAGEGVTLNTDDEFLEGCNCVDDCRDKSKCSCWQLTLSGISFTKLNNEQFPLKGYENRRLHDHIVSGVYECNSKCKCRKTCCNRVVQNGLKVPLQVFKTAAKGWGIRPLYDIAEGSFICIYAGQVLTEQGANEDGKQFGDEYLAELDYIECNEQVKADYESDVTDIEAEDIPEKPKKKRGKGKGKNGNSEDEVDSHANDSSYRGPKPTTSRTITTRNKNSKGNNNAAKDDSDDEDEDGTRRRSRFNPEVRSYKAKKKERLPLREYFGKDEQCYIMDAKTLGNIGRYLNHSCQPNVFVQNVFVDTHDLRFPWVSFFASKHIRAGSELTWDYNYDIGSVPDKVMYCYCGSPECRGRLL